MKNAFQLALAVFAFTSVCRAEDSHSIVLLKGPETDHMERSLSRSGIEFDSVVALPEEFSDKIKVVVLSGAAPPVSIDGIANLEKFMNRGNSVLAVGGGARWAIENKLLDAKGYYPGGTTIHQSAFVGIHPIISGYPGKKPKGNWIKGVPMLLRLTNGPHMETGPKSVSLLSHGPPFSAVAMQSVGTGLLLAIGPDPQGGDLYYTLDKATPTTGEEQGTDRFLANAVTYLLDRQQNLLPNADFKNPLLSPEEYGGWTLVERRGGAAVHTPEKTVKLSSKPEDGVASIQLSSPLIIEPGRTCECRIRIRSTAIWSLRLATRPNPKGADGLHKFPTKYIQAEEGWTEHVETISIPPNHSYLTFQILLSEPGEVEIDNVFLGHAREEKPE